MNSVSTNRNEFHKAVILVFSGLFIVTLIVNYSYRMEFFDSSVKYTFIRSCVTVIIPVLFYPCLVWLSNKLTLLKNWKYVFVHLFLSLIYVAISTFIVQFTLLLIAGYYMFDETIEAILMMLRRQFLFVGSTSFLFYWGITILAGVGSYYDEVCRLIDRTNILESQLSKATLSTLKAQLKPHFLFNTLNMVDYLIHTKPEKAVETVSKLEDLIKSTFDKNQPNSCTVREEILFLEKYLDIERARFSDRLVVEFNIHLETESIKIPCYLIQPLVENSIKHGVGKSIDECKIIISSSIKGDFLIIEVSDNAAGIKKKPKRADWSIGLKNIDERLKLYFGKHAFLDLNAYEHQGFKSSILIPKKYIPDYD